MAETRETRQRSIWRPILPVPPKTPAARFVHSVRGEPLRIFEYRDAQGETLGYVCRFARSAGGIHSLTLTWCFNEKDNQYAWRWMQFPKLRPVYGAERIAQGDGTRALVLVVADEYAAEELRQLPEFKAYVPVSWPGGRSKIGEVDWSVLRGQIVVPWMPHSAERFKVAKGDPQAGDLIPLERQPWRVTAKRLMEMLREFGAIGVGPVEAETTEELQDAWGPIAALNAQWGGQRLYEWFTAHLGTGAERLEAEKLAAGAPPKPGEGELWMKTLIREDGYGRLMPELHNVRILLSHHEAWRGVIYLDEYAHTVMKAKPPPFQGAAVGEWQDTDDSMANDWLASQAGILKLRTSLVAEGVQTVAKLNACNPLVDYLRALKHDGVPRLDSWLIDFLNAGPFTERMSAAEIADLEEYLRIVGRKWLLGAVARALRPGCKFDYVLILEGQQGLGKSSAFAILGGEWTMDTPFSLSDKEGMETIRGMWIIEVAELDAFNKAESTMAKSFFSRTKDRFRLPYAKRSTQFKRACVFGGTTNEEEYFRDPTGNRRYWSVFCGRAGYDQAKLAAVRDQLLAEAVKAYLGGEQIWPSRKEEELMRRHQRRREIPDPWVALIAAWLNGLDAGVGPITRERLLTQALKIDAARIDERGMATRVGKAMHKLDYVKVEDKTIPERFRYEKRQSNEEGVERQPVRYGK